MSEPTPLTAIARPRGATNVQTAVADAARRTNTDFEYLLAQARLESGLRPNAKARTSSATGLFQFIESTWLSTMKRHGPSLGLGDVAASIQRSGNSHYVADPTTRKSILDLRKDPQIASLMAGALAQDNRSSIAPVLGREPQATELYMAHFLGAGDARRFLSELYRDPSQSAPALFPRPASANQSIFYHRSGAPRDLGEVMGLMQGKMDRAIAANGRLPPIQLQPQQQPDPWIAPDTRNLFGDEGFVGYPRSASRTIAANTEPAPFAPSMRSDPVSNSPTNDPQSRPPMSQLLRDSFGLETAQGRSQAHEQVRRAYDDLKAFGL